MTAGWPTATSSSPPTSPASAAASPAWALLRSVESTFHLRAGDDENAPWVPVRVVRVSPRGFGAWSAGLEFHPTNNVEREWLLSWRDAAADAVRAA